MSWHSLCDASVSTASQVRIDIMLASITAESHGVPKLETMFYPLSYGVPVRERYASTLLPVTREQHDQNCTQSH